MRMGTQIAERSMQRRKFRARAGLPPFKHGTREVCAEFGTRFVLVKNPMHASKTLQ